MNSLNTLLLTRSDVASLLTLEDRMGSVERAFALAAPGEISGPSQRRGAITGWVQAMRPLESMILTRT